MKIGMDVAWVVGSLLETRFVWGREGDIRGTARFLQASWQLPHPTAMPLGTRTHRASFQFEGPSPSRGSDQSNIQAYAYVIRSKNPSSRRQKRPVHRRSTPRFGDIWQIMRLFSHPKALSFDQCANMDPFPGRASQHVTIETSPRCDGACRCCRSRGVTRHLHSSDSPMSTYQLSFIIPTDEEQKQ